ncbi:MAG: hypothetical protein JWN40_4772 [Phycisphaerales bacterium]|nr:hypothetical protein [Phycisphaerales bacterium]
MADRTITGRRTLARTLLDAVAHTADNPVDQYALLGGAINAAKDGADVRICFKAADLLAATFEVDGLATKTKATLTMPLRADSPMNTTENARAALELLDTLIAAEDFVSATKLSAILKPIASTDPAVADLIQRRTKDIEMLRAQRDRVAPHLEKLKTMPDDPAANLVVGTYYCFTRGAWAQGLPMLAKSSDADLKKLALEELSGSKTPADAERLGDAWWKVGERQAETIRVKTWQHAAAFYRRALDSSTGLRRVLLEKRIAQAPPPDEPGKVNLLALFDPAKDTLSGVAKLENGALSAGSSKKLRIEFPYSPPPEYDYSVVLRATDSGEFLQILTADGHPFSWRVGAFDGQWSYFEVLDGGRYGRFGDKFAKNKWMTAGERYTWTVKVRRDGVEAFLNDKLATKHKTDYRDVSLLTELKLSRPDIIGLQCVPEVEIESATITEVTGQGHVLRAK